MNTNLLAISNIFASTGSAGPAALKSTAVKQSRQFSPSTLDNRPLTDSRGTETAENTFINPHNTPNNGTLSEFGAIPGIKVSQKGENSKNATKQIQIPDHAIQPSVVQLWLAQYSLNLEHGKQGIAKKVEPKAGYELAQSLKNLRQDIAFSHTENTTKTQIGETVPIINQKQIGLTTALPITSKNSPNEAEYANRIQISNTKLPAAGGVTDQQSGNDLILKALVDANSKITTVSEKPAVVPTLNALGSQKTHPLSVEALVDADSRITNASNKPAIIPVVPGGPKVPEPNSSLPSVYNKASGSQPLPVRIESDKSFLIAENAVENKDSASQPSHPGTKQLSEPLADDFIGKNDNFTGKSVSQKLHNPQLQASTGQIQDRGSSASNNNSDSGFEQILSGNNTATYIKEQSSPFPDTVTTDNLPGQASPSDVSASITKQIMESIYSPSSQQSETQQITIRLNPPELGKVFIKFEEQENQITGLLEVSKAQTRYEVEQTLPHIIQNLADCGIQVKRLEVALTDQGEQQPYRDESLQDGIFQQHHEFSQESNPDSPGTIGTNEPVLSRNNDHYQDSLETDIHITENSINILI
ncbi:MAG: flagellar hook-length control protein FliK [Phycisphaerae bacterium]|nr:flagellar hook-length control protein FliK [Phycisphaerae bacterium]